MKFIAFGLSVVLLGMTGSAGADLCQKCVGKTYIKNIGACTSCKGDTSSGAFKLCAKCSASRHQCEHCLAAIGVANDKTSATKEDLKKKTDPKTDSLRLYAHNDGKKTTTAIGKRIFVSLAGNPTTGYLWKVDKVTGDAVKSQGDPTYVASKAARGKVGTGGTFVFKFQAIKPGRSTLKLVYVRPWEKGKRPERTFAATIDVQGKKIKPQKRGTP